MINDKKDLAARLDALDNVWDMQNYFITQASVNYDIKCILINFQPSNEQREKDINIIAERLKKRQLFIINPN